MCHGGFFFFYIRRISYITVPCVNDRRADFRMVYVELCTCIMTLGSEHFLRTLAISENTNRFSLRDKNARSAK